MKRQIAFILSVCMLVFVCAGCGNSDSKRMDAANDIRVVFIPKLTGNAFFEAANDGAQAYGTDHGFVVDYCGSPEASVADQRSIIEDAIKQEADAICISSLDAKGLDDILKEAMDAGISVVTWDADVSGDARTIMVSQGTPGQLGQMLVEMGAKSLSERGKNPSNDVIKYVWHYSQASVADQNSWQAAGEKYIHETYPNWENVAAENYYSNQDAVKAVAVGETILTEHPDIDLIICNDSTALPGQAHAAQNLGLFAADVTITGLASPNAMREYCKAGIVSRWGLWDCQVQGALGCYLAYYLASGNKLHVGDRINVPEIGILEVMPNTVLEPNAYTAENSGVVLLPGRTEFTINNVDDYDF